MDGVFYVAISYNKFTVNQRWYPIQAIERQLLNPLICYLLWDYRALRQLQKNMMRQTCFKYRMAWNGHFFHYQMQKNLKGSVNWTMTRCKLQNTLQLWLTIIYQRSKRTKHDTLILAHKETNFLWLDVSWKRSPSALHCLCLIQSFARNYLL